VLLDDLADQPFTFRAAPPSDARTVLHLGAGGAGCRKRQGLACTALHLAEAPGMTRCLTTDQGAVRGALAAPLAAAAVLLRFRARAGRT
jgi:hypothetical protein